MKTDALIDLLAAGPLEVRGRPVTRRLGLALAAGGLLAFGLMAGWLGVRSDLGEMMTTPAMWTKVFFVLTATAAALWVTVRLARPGVTPGAAWLVLTMPFVLIWTVAAVQISVAGPGERMDMFLGRTWAECPWRIGVLSIPTLVLNLWAMRSLAPTRLRLAGASAGLFSGALAASIYTLHCPETAAPFLGFWYVLGMLIPTAIGAALGPRLLRW